MHVFDGMILLAPHRRYKVSCYYCYTSLIKNRIRFFSLSSRELIAKAERKIPGSVQYRKLWRYFCHQYYEEVRSSLEQNIGSNINLLSAKNLEHDLGAIGANQGVMPNFSDIGALRYYTLNHFGRARLMGHLLVQPENEWLSNRVSELFKNNTNEAVKACSLGGGPGYDFLSLSALSEFYGGSSVHMDVHDYESTWKDIVYSMEKSIIDICGHSKHSCNFDLCDITHPLNSTINNEISKNIDSIDIFTCSYCIVENAMKLSKTDFIFFHDILLNASPGTLFLFTDTTHRLWPSLIDIARNIGDLRIAAPYVRVGKCGWQLVLLKDTSIHYRHSSTATASNSIIDTELYNRFVRDYEAHTNRLSRGWKRDSRKVRGSKK